MPKFLQIEALVLPTLKTSWIFSIFSGLIATGLPPYRPRRLVDVNYQTAKDHLASWFNAPC